MKDGKFIGLALDEENQPNLTPKRIGDWIAEIKKNSNKILFIKIEEVIEIIASFFMKNIIK